MCDCRPAKGHYLGHEAVHGHGVVIVFIQRRFYERLLQERLDLESARLLIKGQSVDPKHRTALVNGHREKVNMDFAPEVWERQHPISQALFGIL